MIKLPELNKRFTNRRTKKRRKKSEMKKAPQPIRAPSKHVKGDGFYHKDVKPKHRGSEEEEEEEPAGRGKAVGEGRAERRAGVAEGNGGSGNDVGEEDGGLREKDGKRRGRDVKEGIPEGREGDDWKAHGKARDGSLREDDDWNVQGVAQDGGGEEGKRRGRDVKESVSEGREDDDRNSHGSARDGGLREVQEERRGRDAKEGSPEGREDDDWDSQDGGPREVQGKRRGRDAEEGGEDGDRNPHGKSEDGDLREVQEKRRERDAKKSSPVGREDDDWKLHGKARDGGSRKDESHKGKGEIHLQRDSEEEEEEDDGRHKKKKSARKLANMDEEESDADDDSDDGKPGKPGKPKKTKSVRKQIAEAKISNPQKKQTGKSKRAAARKPPAPAAAVPDSITLRQKAVHSDGDEDEVNLDEGRQQAHDRRLITLPITRSGAVNTLTSRFLRDSDESVQARKVKSTLPFVHREIEPRIYKHLPFPIRQDWSRITTGDELHKMEEEYFEQYLDLIYRGRAVERLSPFEHNLEVWRQLWRVLEKSDVIVMTADIRDPLLHIAISFHAYVTKYLRLPVIIVLTKCDLVSETHANAWKSFLERAFGRKEGDESVGETIIVLNSGKCQSTHGIGGFNARRKILQGRATKLQIAEMHRQALRVLDVAMDTAQRKIDALGGGEEDRIPRIGIVGQPNTGKSSLVNAMLGRHAVSVSRTCGHTKHWQTQNVKDAEERVIATLIDSPGIIFPMAVDDDASSDAVRNEKDTSPRAWFECSGLYPIAQIRETFSAVRFVSERIDLPRSYNLKFDDDYGEEWSPYAVVGILADKRGYFLSRGGGAPDMHRAGLEIIYDVCDGLVLLCFCPPDYEKWKRVADEELVDEKM